MKTTMFAARHFGVLTLVLFILCPLVGMAQGSSPNPVRPRALLIDNGIRTYNTLNNTMVSMTGRSELHFTAANDPMPGCLININSPDAWLFFENIRPSLVTTNHLLQLRVNGEPAIANSNVRVVAYATGTVVIPHPPDYLPLQVFEGNRFTGSSMELGLYTYHAGATLGAMNNAIASFILKRGYMATFAQQSNGSGISRVYVAQDADIKVSALPAELNRAVGFVRVIPWRWTGKKGWAGGVQPLVNPLWNYDWDNATTSSADVEYVPMRHNLNWNAYSNINNKTGSTHALGFNEPDRPDQANMSVATTLSEWPNLMASGLRLGSPATSDGGLNWLYDFIDQADALNYRVDYVGVHYYKGGWTAAQLREWLLGIHLRTGRPLWVTEWNNGANWTCCAPTLESNAQTISEFMDVMNEAPFVERYSIYNWVGPNREMILNGELTPAGVVYRDKASPSAYLQELPSGSGPDARYLLSGNTMDSTGSGNDGVPIGAPSFTLGRPGGQGAIKLDGLRDYVQLPAGLAQGNSFTFGGWVNWDGGAGSQRIFDLGGSFGRYLFLTPSSANATLRFAISMNGVSGEQRLDGPALMPGVWTHVAVTIDGSTGKLFVNGALVATNSNMTISPAAVKTKYNYLGKSQSSADPLFAGQLSEVYLAGYALTDAQVASMPVILPPRFAGDHIVKPDGSLYQLYSDSIASDASTPGGGALSFNKLSGPSWLTVDADGKLVGRPGLTDVGTNNFAVRVINSSGMAAVTLLTIKVTAPPQPLARYAFESDTRSSVGFADAVSAGFPAYSQRPSGRAIVFDGRNSFVTLPRGIASSCSDITVAAWVQWNGGGNWQRIFDFGNGTSQYLFLTPSSPSGRLRFAIKNGGSEQALETSALPIGQWTHVAVTLSGSTGSLYVNGSLAATSENFTIRPSDFKPAQSYIGKSQWPDPLLNGSIDEFLVYNHALSAEQIATLVTNGNPPSFVSNMISRPDAAVGRFYKSSIAGTAVDDDPGEILTYSKVSGPSWLKVGVDGSLSGDPVAGDAGKNTIMVRVTDRALLSSDATLIVNIPTAPPLAPVELKATPGYAHVNLTWAGVPNATSYNVKRARMSGGPYVTIASSVNATGYLDTGLANDTITYYYVVSAVNSIAESADSVESGAKPSSSTVVDVPNAGFETPVTTSFVYNPAGTPWTFFGASGNGSGVAANNSGFTRSNPVAPEGVQVAFLQGSSIISQTLSGLVKGKTYKITFMAAQRTRATQVGQTWDVRIDGMAVASFAPPQSSTNYVKYEVTFTATAFTHTLALVGTNVRGGDNTSFVDDIKVEQLVP